MRFRVTGELYQPTCYGKPGTETAYGDAQAMQIPTAIDVRLSSRAPRAPSVVWFCQLLWEFHDKVRKGADKQVQYQPTLELGAVRYWYTILLRKC
eukprot:3941628-Rhodomonas_salina.1